jgi:CRP/FNR family transcriptional regulator
MMLSTIEPIAVSTPRRCRSVDDRDVSVLDEGEREFEALRQKHVEAPPRKPIVRLAAFLAAVSRLSAFEGRDPYFIDDTLNCAVIADYLGMRLDILAMALMQLEAKGIVQPAPDRGLRLLDVAALEAMTCEGSEHSAAC